MKLNLALFLVIILFQLSCKVNSDRKKFPIIRQESSMQCGPICLQMIGKYYGRDLDIKMLETISKMDDTGTSLFGLSEASDSIGLENLSLKISFETLLEEMPLPAIIHWRGIHFVVVYHITNEKVFIADPSQGKISYSKKEFCENWLLLNEESEKKGIIMLLEATNKFYESN